MYNPIALSRKRYLITGAASGIGKETSIVLSKLGAELILVDVDENGLNATAELLETKCNVLPLNLSDIKSIKPAVENAASEFGLLNGFAHLAGLPYISPIKGVKEEKADLLYKVNQYAAIELTKVFNSKKVYSGVSGSIVLISSVYGVVGSAANVAYAMTKSAIIGITKALAIELAPKKIRVNCIAPGFVKSKMMADNTFRFENDYIEKLDALHPLGLGDPEDVANGIAFLFSDMSKWTTGAVINIDGGFTAQ